MVFISRTMPASRQAATMASASAREVAIGFSTHRHFTLVRPARTIRAMSSTTLARGAAEVQTLTMSGRSRSSSSS